MLPLEFHPDVKDDIKTSYQWYEHQTEGLGDDFIKTLELSLKVISESPKTWPFIGKSIRRCVLPTFPYSILYSLRSDKIFVIAIMHNRRKPYSWLKRISD